MSQKKPKKNIKETNTNKKKEKFFQNCNLKLLKYFITGKFS